MTELVETWWYFFPAMLLNLTLYLSGLWFGQDSLLPIDLRQELSGRRLIGDGRGLSGLPWCLLVAAFCSWAQGRGVETLVQVTGAQVGMIGSSVVKRRLGIPRGKPTRPWDHIDFILGAVVFQAVSGDLSLGLALGGLILCGLTHWLVGGVIKSALGDR